MCCSHTPSFTAGGTWMGEKVTERAQCGKEDWTQRPSGTGWGVTETACACPQDVGVVNSWRKSSWGCLASLLLPSPLQTSIRSQLFSNGCPLFPHKALRGARLRFAPWGRTVHLCFLFHLWGWIVWWLLRILFQWKLHFPRFLLIHECLVCALLTFSIVPSGGKARKNSQQDCSLLSDAGWEGQKKPLSAPFFCLACPLIVPGSSESSCRFLPLDRKLCREAFAQS